MSFPKAAIPVVLASVKPVTFPKAAIPVVLAAVKPVTLVVVQWGLR